MFVLFKCHRDVNLGHVETQKGQENALYTDITISDVLFLYVQVKASV